MKAPKGAPRTVVLKLTQDEARTLETSLDEFIRDTRLRHPKGSSIGADQVVDRYEAMAHKVRVARNPEAYRRQLTLGEGVRV